MRQALGLRSSGNGQPVAQRREGEQRGRRFVKDGEVPVVVVHSASREGNDGTAPVNRIAAAEQAARAERNAREQAERALAEAQATVQHLRTQLAHAEMAHREALAGERRAREQAELALQEAAIARAAAEAHAAELEAAAPRMRRAAVDVPLTDDAAASSFAAPPRLIAARGAADPADPSAPRKRGRPKRIIPVDPEMEPEPVKWWLPTYRASTRRR
jgi:hypothetical protein